MSNKSNEERLKILQERLNQIHKKNNSTETEHPEKAQEEHVRQSNEILEEQPVQEKPKLTNIFLCRIDSSARLLFCFYLLVCLLEHDTGGMNSLQKVI